MKEAELAKHTTCSLCARLVSACGLPLFWRVKVERFGISLPALKRQAGLSDFLGGNAALARIMGPDEDVAGPVMEPVTLTVCDRCATEGALPIAAMVMP
jgi:hypothetical protein